MMPSSATESDSLMVGGIEPPSGWWWAPSNRLDSLLLTGSVLYGMNGGIFFIFSACVMPSLAAVSDSEGIEVMQKINDVIQNFWFFLVWGGGFFQGVAQATVLLRGREKARSFVYWKYGLASSLCYILGCILVTVLAHVPRNDALAGMDPDGSEAASYWREEYLTKWVAWNHVRTAFCILACILSTMALRITPTGSFTPPALVATVV
uniref:DUF1772 domain-containing protein n=1 Tax=Odontella aurita TaxID=265563 RepID=A0A7S4HVM0_9STRA|mmetsp:Transcript_15798/g.45373  ORF Transcript_15798/g.45373 Transcript_15798/m.45373 type:complete len:207 (+) Transcript_15798:61-681(+)